MRVQTYVTIFGWSIGVIGVFGLFVANDIYVELGIDSRYKLWAAYACLLFVLIAIFSVLVILYRLIYTNIRSSGYFGDKVFYFSKVADATDIEYIISNSSAETDDATDDAETRHLFDLDNKSFTIIKDERGIIRGYYCVIRLTKLGEDAVKQGVFSVKKINNKYVRSDKDKYIPLYIGGVYGSTSSSLNTYLVGTLNGHIKQTKSRAVYARAASKKGLHWLERYHFKPVDDEKAGLGELYCLYTATT